MPVEPQDGDSYYDSELGATLIYSDGEWYVMAQDGLDGPQGDTGLSINWLGSFDNAPDDCQVNDAYYDTTEKCAFVCISIAPEHVWKLMTKDGSDGVDGIDGEDGNSLFITYNDNAYDDKPANPTGDGTTDGWHTNATADVVWMSQKLAASVEEGEWGDPIRIKGIDGKSVNVVGHYDDYDSFHDDWYDGDENPINPATVVRPGTSTMGTESDAYVVEIDNVGDLFVWDGDSWEDVGQFSGKDGEGSWLHVMWATKEAPTVDDLRTLPDKFISTIIRTGLTDSEPTPQEWVASTWTKWEGNDGYGYEYVFINSTVKPIGLDESATDSQGRTHEDDDYLPRFILAGGVMVEADDDAKELSKTATTRWRSSRKKMPNAEGVMVWNPFGPIVQDASLSVTTLQVVKFAHISEDPVIPEYEGKTIEELREDPEWTEFESEQEIVAPAQGDYRYILTVTVYTDGTSKYDLLSSYMGIDGQDGVDGEPGTSGLISYPAGSWSPDKTYTCTDKLTPYVLYDIQTESYHGTNFYYRLIKNYPEGTHPHPEITEYWELVEDYSTLFAKVMIAENGQLGQFIFSHDYMLSSSGKLYTWPCNDPEAVEAIVMYGRNHTRTDEKVVYNGATYYRWYNEVADTEVYTDVKDPNVDDVLYNADFQSLIEMDTDNFVYGWGYKEINILTNPEVTLASPNLVINYNGDFDRTTADQGKMYFVPNLSINQASGKMVANDIVSRGIIEARGGKLGDVIIDEDGLHGSINSAYGDGS